jgi:aryl-alcohol dehydrogenase-like predicted oxidoreductase
MQNCLLIERDVETEVIPACETYGVGMLPYFPLASGLLTGKYRRGLEPPADGRISAWGMNAVLNDHNFDIVDALTAFAAERSVTLLDVAMGGLAAQSTVASVIAGATTPEQVRANAAAGLWTPTAEDQLALRALLA